MEDKRMIGDYQVINSMYIGHRDIILGENPDAVKEERYLCCYVEQTSLFERYTEAVASDDFAEIVKIYGERMTRAAEDFIKEEETAKAEIGENEEIANGKCTKITWEESIENKVIVIKGNVLRPEFRHASHQLYLCTGGFGAQPNARGRTCYCTSLFDGRKTSYYRSDVLGVIEPENLPEWAQKGLAKALEINQEERKPPEERGEAERGEAR